MIFSISSLSFKERISSTKSAQSITSAFGVNFFSKDWYSSTISPIPGSFFKVANLLELLFFINSKICWSDSSLLPLLLRSINSSFGPL